MGWGNFFGYKLEQVVAREAWEALPVFSGACDFLPRAPHAPAGQSTRNRFAERSIDRLTAFPGVGFLQTGSICKNFLRAALVVNGVKPCRLSRKLALAGQAFALGLATGSARCGAGLLDIPCRHDIRARQQSFGGGRGVRRRSAGYRTSEQWILQRDAHRRLRGLRHSAAVGPIGILADVHAKSR